MNELQIFFNGRQEADINKWSNYFEIYERYFSRFRNRPVHFLEIGVDRGGSSQMWKHYFGKDALVVGIDICPECKKFENCAENRFIEIGDQSDPEFLRRIIDKYNYFDIILDDGSHFSHHQIKSFEILWSAVSDSGIYMVEDVHTSYYLTYAGWVGKGDTFIEYSKKVIDDIFLWHRMDSQGNDMLKKSLQGISFHSGIVVFEKTQVKEPYSARSGQSPAFRASEEALLSAEYVKKASSLRRLLWKLKHIFYLITCNQVKATLYEGQLEAWCILHEFSPKN